MLCGSLSSLGILPSGKRCRVLPTGTRYGTSRTCLGGRGRGCPSAPPVLPHSGLVGWTPVILPPILRHSWGSKLSGKANPGRNVPPLSSGVRRPFSSSTQVRSMARRPCSPSWPHWFGGPHVQITMSECQNPAGGKSPVLTQEAHCLCKSTPPDNARSSRISLC